MLTPDGIRVATGGCWSGRALLPSGSFAGVSTDSRQLAAGELFVALVGPRFDGHDYIAEAARRGAAAAVVQRDVRSSSGLPLLRVGDTLEALAALAGAARRSIRGPVVAITGSVGKTTTKEMAAALLASRGPVLKTAGNLNNRIGLPLSLLRVRPEHTAAVLELGMSAPGELRVLASIAQPDVAVITNVAPVHLEFFASLDAIAEAKAEILEGLGPDGIAVLNHDDPRLRAIGARHRGEVLWFGNGNGAGVRAEGWSGDAAGARFTLVWQGRPVPVELPLPGAHATADFLAAAAVALRLGLDPSQLRVVASSLRPAQHRGGILLLGHDVLVIDDSYNANPVAVEAAVAVLAAHAPRRRVAFLGDMLELGPSAPELHRAVGAKIAPAIDVLVAVGALAAGFVEGARGAGGRSDLVHVADARAAAALVPEIVRPGDAVLVKASRGVRLEVVVDALRAHLGAEREA